MTLRESPSAFDLTGKVALVTGATGHLGGAIAQALCEAGATIVATSRNEQRAVACVETLPRGSQPCHAGIGLDHLDESSISRGFQAALEHAGHVDILINNAHEPTSHDWTDISGDDFTRQLANATGYFLLARHLRNHAVERGAPASIVMLGSMYGQVASYPEVYEGLGPANSVAYQALKGAILQMTRHLAVYWARDGVRVNCLSPGPFPGDKAPAELLERLDTKTPLGRTGLPHELAGAVLLLASDAGSYLTGHNLVVDGGWTAW